MKYVQVPEDIQIMADGKPWKNEDESIEDPWSFSTYLEKIILEDPGIGTGYKELKACSIVDGLFRNAFSNTWIGVEDEHWEMLRKTISDPKGGGVPNSVLRQLIPFMDAVLEAKNEKPVE